MKTPTMLRATVVGLLAMLAAGTFAAAAPAASDLQVLQRWKLGGAGGWDYLTLDAAGKHLFLSRATHVDIVDTAWERSSAPFRTPRGSMASRWQRT